MSWVRSSDPRPEGSELGLEEGSVGWAGCSVHFKRQSLWSSIWEMRLL